MKALFLVAVCLAISIGSVHCQKCLNTKCTQRQYGTNLSGRGAYNAVNGAAPGKNPTNRGKRDVSYEKPTYEKPTYEKPPQVHNPGKVIVMPPPGVAPKDVPQIGTPGGGAHPSTDPYTADMAPDGTVPIAVFPPFAEYKKNPTKCVIFSELTDFEQDPIDYGDGPKENELSYGQSHKPSYAPTHTNRIKRQSGFNPLSIFSSRRPAKPQSSFRAPPAQSSYAPPAQSSYAPPPSYAPPSYEPPPRVIYRKFGYVCEITVSDNFCRIGTECDRNGNRLFKKQNQSYGRPKSNLYVDTLLKRAGYPVQGQGSPQCTNSVVPDGNCGGGRGRAQG